MFARRRSFLSLNLRRRTGLKFSFLAIYSFLQFHSAISSPVDQWQFNNQVGAASSPGRYNEIGYECGNDFFSDSDINEALSMYHHHVNQIRQSPPANQASLVNPNIRQHHFDAIDPLEIEDFDVDQFLNFEEFDTPLESNSPRGYQHSQQHFTPIIYQGPLYSDSGSLNYILWPIQKRETFSSPTKYPSEPYYIVINKQNGEVIDVISRITNNDYTKCIRINGPETESSTAAPYMNSGYQCGHEFISDTLIQKSLHLVVNDEGILNKYPTPYEGRLYPENNGYMIWPIFSRNGLYDYDSVEAGPYFLVIDRQGNFIRTVVEGQLGNLLRCARARKPSTTPLTNTPNHASRFVSTSPVEYHCGRIIFNDNAISDAITAAKNKARARSSSKLPVRYKGPPFNEIVFLWPLLLNGLVYKIGAQGIYRVVLSRKLEFIGVGIMINGIIQFCEKHVMEEGKNHEKYDYYCFNHHVLNRHVEKAAEIGCRALAEKDFLSYPARYEGPLFDKSGPYFTYPVLQGGKFVKNPGRDRVVITSKCEIVGAITFISKKVAENGVPRFVLCVKYRGISETTFIEPHMTIVEHRIEDKY